MKKLGNLAAAFAVCAAVSLSGCASPGKRTAIGAGTGAVAGGAVGGAIGGWKGAAIGAGVGAVAGGAVGNKLDKRAKELAQVAEAQATKEGILVKLKNDLLIDTGSAILKPAAIEEVSKLGDILAKYPDDKIRVEGHTDSTGRAPANEALSVRRAEAVKNVLRSRGVSEARLLVMGLGQTRPVADNATKAGRSMNRRVELHIEVPPNKRG